MAKRSQDARLKLGQPLADKLADFCSANYNCPQIEVIRAAVDELIDRRLEAEPEMRRRFESARKRRIGGGENVTVMTPRKSEAAK